MSYSNEAAAKFFLQRAFAILADIKRIGNSSNPETLLILSYHSALYASKALLYSADILADDEAAILEKMVEGVEKGIATTEMFGILYEMSQVYAKLNFGDLTPIKSAESDAAVQNLRSFVRSVREMLEKKYGLIEGLQG